MRFSLTHYNYLIIRSSVHHFAYFNSFTPFVKCVANSLVFTNSLLFIKFNCNLYSELFLYTVVCQIGHYIYCLITKPLTVLRQRSALYRTIYHFEIHYTYHLNLSFHIKSVPIKTYMCTINIL